MIIVGVDAHKNTHTLVAVDAVGRRVAELTVPARAGGHTKALQWLRGFGPVLVAVEDCRHLTRRFEVDLLAAGHSVVRVHTRLMAGARRSARERGKSDPIDAEAVSRVALREPNLPRASLAGPTREVKLLSDHRRMLVSQRTALCNKARWFLHEIDPEMDIPSRSLDRLCVLDRITGALAGHDGVVTQIAAELIADIRALTVRINKLASRLTQLVRQIAPALLAIPGCGVLGAAAIIGETAGVTRFASKAAYARFNGTAPIPVWSGNKVRVRLNRGGNRTINHALHMIAITQIRLGGEGSAYYAKLQATGKSTTEAKRLLRRRISDRIYQMLDADARAEAGTTDAQIVPLTSMPAPWLAVAA